MLYFLIKTKIIKKMSKKVSKANPGIKALAKKAPEVVKKMGYSMQMNKPKVTDDTNFSDKSKMLMAKSSLYMVGKSESTDPNKSTTKVEYDAPAFVGTASKPPSPAKDAAEYAANLEDARRNIYSDIYENIHKPDSTVAQINRGGITYKKGYDHRYASDYTSSDAGSYGGTNNIYLGRGTNQRDGAPSFEFKFSKSDKVASEKKGDAMQGGSSGQWAMIRQYNEAASKKYAEKKLEIQKNYPGLNFGGR
jgi:hypothetical protein